VRDRFAVMLSRRGASRCARFVWFHLYDGRFVNRPYGLAIIFASAVIGLRFGCEYSHPKSGKPFLRRKNLRRRNLHKLYGCICHGVQGAASPAGAPGQSPAVSPHVLTKGGTLPPLLIIIDDSRETAGIPPRGGTLTESARQARDGGRLCSHLLYTAINIL